MFDFLFDCTVKHRCRYGNPFAQITRQLQNFRIAERRQILLLTAEVIDLVKKSTQLLGVGTGIQHVANLHADTGGRPAQVCFQNLADIHTRWHTKRIEHDIHRRTVLVIRHVFHRYDHGNNTFVTMTSGHLVTRLNATFNGHIHLDHLQNTRREIVTGCYLVAFFLQALIKLFDK